MFDLVFVLGSSEDNLTGVENQSSKFRILHFENKTWKCLSLREVVNDTSYEMEPYNALSS